MRSPLRISIYLGLAAVFAAVASVQFGAQVAQSGRNQDPLLETLNGEFIAQYQAALADSLAQVGPVIFEEGNDCILIRKGERTRVEVKPVEYHELKAVAHIPLALYVMLSFPHEESLSATRIERLRHYRELMAEARRTLPSRHFTPDQLDRQQKIFTASFKFLDGVLAAGRVDREALSSFAREIAPLLLANVRDAAAVELERLYAAAAAWRKELSPAEWNALHVVMIGPHMPREREISMQFFERLFHERTEGQRVIYAEALWKEQDAFNLLATHIVDEAAGQAFFGDPMRMHRDLLSDAATAYLDAHPLNP
jgi:hypothetical protein